MEQMDAGRVVAGGGLGFDAVLRHMDLCGECGSGYLFSIVGKLAIVLVLSALDGIALGGLRVGDMAGLAKLEAGASAFAFGVAGDLARADDGVPGLRLFVRGACVRGSVAGVGGFFSVAKNGIDFFFEMTILSISHSNKAVFFFNRIFRLHTTVNQFPLVTVRSSSHWLTVLCFFLRGAKWQS